MIFKSSSVLATPNPPQSNNHTAREIHFSRFKVIHCYPFIPPLFSFFFMLFAVRPVLHVVVYCWTVDRLSCYIYCITPQECQEYKLIMLLTQSGREVAITPRSVD